MDLCSNAGRTLRGRAVGHHPLQRAEIGKGADHVLGWGSGAHRRSHLASLLQVAVSRGSLCKCRHLAKFRTNVGKGRDFA
jgi:hypothetical protein